MGGESINISYESLFEIRMLEKKRSELQELSQTFFEDVKNYIGEKEKILRMAKENNFSAEEIQKTERQMEQINKILSELYHLREDKIIKLAILESKSDNNSMKAQMLKEEVELYLELKGLLGKHKSNMMKKYKSVQCSEEIAPAKEIHLPPKASESGAASENTPLKTRKLKFLLEMPQFIGRNMEAYGPFQTEDISLIPEYLAEILVKKGKAEFLND